MIVQEVAGQLASIVPAQANEALKVHASPCSCPEIVNPCCFAMIILSVCTSAACLLHSGCYPWNNFRDLRLAAS